jgi:hypothetical protein
VRRHRRGRAVHPRASRQSSMMRERRAVAGAGAVDGEWKLTSEVFWQPEAGEQVSLCLSCILVCKLLHSSNSCEIWFDFASEHAV